VDSSALGSKPKPARPDKLEACPRCGSTDTKFCYYNNYNMKQPRYFCKASLSWAVAFAPCSAC
jgi:hypothetical protein